MEKYESNWEKGETIRGGETMGAKEEEAIGEVETVREKKKR